MTTNSKNTKSINYACSTIKKLESFDYETILANTEHPADFIVGILLLAGLNSVDVDTSSQTNIFYEIALDGERKDVLSYEMTQNELSGRYFGLFIDTIKAIFAVECILTESTLLLPATLRKNRIQETADQLHISSNLIAQIAAKCPIIED